jgi:hypothetical protein
MQGPKGEWVVPFWDTDKLAVVFILLDHLSAEGGGRLAIEVEVDGRRELLAEIILASEPSTPLDTQGYGAGHAFILSYAHLFAGAPRALRFFLRPEIEGLDERERLIELREDHKGGESCEIAAVAQTPFDGDIRAGLLPAADLEAWSRKVRGAGGRGVVAYRHADGSYGPAREPTSGGTPDGPVLAVAARAYRRREEDRDTRLHDQARHVLTDRHDWGSDVASIWVRLSRDRGEAKELAEQLTFGRLAYGNGDQVEIYNDGEQSTRARLLEPSKDVGEWWQVVQDFHDLAFRDCAFVHSRAGLRFQCDGTEPSTLVAFEFSGVDGLQKEAIAVLRPDQDRAKAAIEKYPEEARRDLPTTARMIDVLRRSIRSVIDEEHRHNDWSPIELTLESLVNVRIENATAGELLDAANVIVALRSPGMAKVAAKALSDADSLSAHGGAPARGPIDLIGQILALSSGVDSRAFRRWVRERVRDQRRLWRNLCDGGSLDDLAEQVRSDAQFIAWGDIEAGDRAPIQAFARRVSKSQGFRRAATLVAPSEVWLRSPDAWSTSELLEMQRTVDEGGSRALVQLGALLSAIPPPSVFVKAFANYSLSTYLRGEGRSSDYGIVREQLEAIGNLIEEFDGERTEFERARVALTNTEQDVLGRTTGGLVTAAVAAIAAAISAERARVVAAAQQLLREMGVRATNVADRELPAILNGYLTAAEPGGATVVGGGSAPVDVTRVEAIRIAAGNLNVIAGSGSLDASPWAGEIAKAALRISQSAYRIEEQRLQDEQRRHRIAQIAERFGLSSASGARPVLDAIEEKLRAFIAQAGDVEAELGRLDVALHAAGIERSSPSVREVVIRTQEVHHAAKALVDELRKLSEEVKRETLGVSEPALVGKVIRAERELNRCIERLAAVRERVDVVRALRAEVALHPVYEALRDAGLGPASRFELAEIVRVSAYAWHERKRLPLDSLRRCLAHPPSRNDIEALHRDLRQLASQSEAKVEGLEGVKRSLYKAVEELAFDVMAEAGRELSGELELTNPVAGDGRRALEWLERAASQGLEASSGTFGWDGLTQGQRAGLQRAITRAMKRPPNA